MRKIKMALGAAAMMAAVIAVVNACGKSSTDSGKPLSPGTAAYLVSVFSPLAYDTFQGNWIQIQGHRDGLADPKYPCANEFRVCVPLDAGGSAPPIHDLCPTVNSPVDGAAGTGTGMWSFTYRLFTDSGCITAMPNLLCPDTVGEALSPGATVTNTVRCLTSNAAKDVNMCITDPVTGATTPVGCASCKARGVSCGASSECCSGICSEGQCACSLVGESCSGLACCGTAQCISGTCQPQQDRCSGNPCGQHGTCYNTYDRVDYKCVCDAGWSGTACDVNINECASVTCLNGGFCHDELNAFTCICPAGFTGTFCETPISTEIRRTERPQRGR